MKDNTPEDILLREAKRVLMEHRVNEMPFSWDDHFEDNSALVVTIPRHRVNDAIYTPVVMSRGVSGTDTMALATSAPCGSRPSVADPGADRRRIPLGYRLREGCARLVRVSHRPDHAPVRRGGCWPHDQFGGVVVSVDDNTKLIAEARQELNDGVMQLVAHRDSKRSEVRLAEATDCLRIMRATQANLLLILNALESLSASVAQAKADDPAVERAMDEILNQAKADAFDEAVAMCCEMLGVANVNWPNPYRGSVPAPVQPDHTLDDQCPICFGVCGSNGEPDELQLHMGSEVGVTLQPEPNCGCYGMRHSANCTLPAPVVQPEVTTEVQPALSDVPNLGSRFLKLPKYKQLKILRDLGESSGDVIVGLTHLRERGLLDELAAAVAGVVEGKAGK